jgi:tRNA dimethylallyltransferase
MDIGTGKISRDFSGESESRKSKVLPAMLRTALQTGESHSAKFVSGGIRHHLLDIASPKRSYTVTHFLRDARLAISDIRKRGKTPIICGGTNFWIEALVFDTEFPEVKPDPALRKQLAKLTAPELFTLLSEKDPYRTETIDRHNKVRLIRALEIVATLGKVPKVESSGQITVNEKRETGDGIWKSTQAMPSGFLPFTKGVPSPRGEGFSPSEFQFFGIDLPKDVLHERIQKRLKERLRQGMIEEVKRLHEEEGLSWKRLDGFGLEYRWCARYLQGKISREEMEESLLKDRRYYEKRQMSSHGRLERKGLKIEWKNDIA